MWELATKETGVSKSAWKSLHDDKVFTDLYVKDVGASGHCFFYVVRALLNDAVNMKTIRQWLTTWIFAHLRNKYDPLQTGTSLPLFDILTDMWRSTGSKHDPPIYTRWTAYAKEKSAANKKKVEQHLRGTCEADEVIIPLLPFVLRDNGVPLRLIILDSNLHVSIFPSLALPFAPDEKFGLLWYYSEDVANNQRGHYVLLGWQKQALFDKESDLPAFIRNNFLHSLLDQRIAEDHKGTLKLSTIQSDLEKGKYTAAQVQANCAKFTAATQKHLCTTKVPATIQNLTELSKSDFLSPSSFAAVIRNMIDTGEVTRAELRRFQYLLPSYLHALISERQGGRAIRFFFLRTGR